VLARKICFEEFRQPLKPITLQIQGLNFLFLKRKIIYGKMYYFIKHTKL